MLIILLFEATLIQNTPHADGLVDFTTEYNMSLCIEMPHANVP